MTKTKDPIEPTSPLTLEEMFETLTGFEDLAIKQSWGTSAAAMAESDPTAMLRALVFVDQLRRGLTPIQAKDHAMGLTMRHTMGYFTPDPEEVDPDEPVTIPGKDSPLAG